MAVGVFAIAFTMLNACTKTQTEPTVPNVGVNDPSQQNPDPNGNNNEAATLNYSKKTTAVMLEFTSTGCPGCGGWGKPTFKSITEANATDVTPIAVHIKYGDPMITNESNALGANRHGQYYTPQIWVNDVNGIVLQGGINASASIQKINDEIQTSIAMEQPALSAKVEKDGNMLKVTYGTKFIDVMASGEYALSCYLMEDGLEYYQTSSASNPTIHNHVIRTSADGAFGKTFTSTDLTDSEMKRVHTFDISAYNSDNVYVAVILWKKDGERFMPVNGFSVK